jgi:hypothetical protein
MKNLLLLTAGCLFFNLSIAQTSESTRVPELFCLKSQGDKLVVVHDGNALNKRIKLAKGARLTPEGTVIWKDKTRTALRPGQCVDQTGSIINTGADNNASEELKSELNDIQSLPEVTVEEKLFSDLLDSTIAERADDFLQSSFIAYALKSRNQILSNEKTILEMKDKLALAPSESSKKIERQIYSLEQENLELKNDLIQFLHLGKGSWKNFSEEFNDDMKPLMQDIADLQADID